MDNKIELLKELEDKFNKLKSELKFNSTLEEVDKYFFIKDLILERRFVSEDFSNQLRARIIETMINWDNYLHSLVMPNPQNLFNLNESKAFDQNEKKEIMKMMSRVAHFVSRNTLLRLTRSKKEEGKFIDESLKFWKEIYTPFFVKIMEKVESHWGEVKGEGKL